MPKHVIDESSLTKGEARKLEALRKSLGQEIADEAFAKWRARQVAKGPTADPNVARMEEALNPLAGKMQFPRGVTYTVKRGRGRVIIEPVVPQAKAKKRKKVNK